LEGKILGSSVWVLDGENVKEECFTVKILDFEAEIEAR
jgi:hypothetical protein